MKSLTAKLNEAIQDNDETIITNTHIEVNRALAEKIAKKFYTVNSTKTKKYDGLGQRLEEGDIVITINTTNSEIGCITQINDPEDEECIIVYAIDTIKARKENRSIYPFEVIKLENPKKYL